MALTAAQTATLKAFILADPLLGPKTSGPGTDYGFIADYLTDFASPVQLAWRIDVPPADSDDAPSYSSFDTIAAGKRDSWGFFLGHPRNYTRNKVRTWVTDVWGNATAGSNAESILQAATEKARRVEVALGGSTKTTGTVSALDRNYVGTVSLSEIAAMFNV
jgi:hypothetical protein